MPICCDWPPFTVTLCFPQALACSHCDCCGWERRAHPTLPFGLYPPQSVFMLTIFAARGILPSGGARPLCTPNPRWNQLRLFCHAIAARGADSTGLKTNLCCCGNRSTTRWMAAAVLVGRRRCFFRRLSPLLPLLVVAVVSSPWPSRRKPPLPDKSGDEDASQRRIKNQ